MVMLLGAASEDQQPLRLVGGENHLVCERERLEAVGGVGGREQRWKQCLLMRFCGIPSGLQEV